MRTLCLALIFNSVYWLNLSAEPTQAPPQPERIVAIGDIHADPDALNTILLDRKLIDSTGKWIGGNTQLVLMGDLVHRGPNSLQVIQTVMRLEKEAAAAGGQVHALIGNHDLMVLGREIDAVKEDEQTSNKNGKPRYFSTPEERNEYYPYADTRMGRTLSRGGRNTTTWPAYVAAFNSNESDIAAWMRTRKAVVQIGDTLFCHAAWANAADDYSIDNLNAAVAKYIESQQEGGRPIPKDHPLKDAIGVVLQTVTKSRELAKELVPVQDLLASLNKHKARRVVIGHTTTDSGHVETRYGGRVVLIDTGNSAAYRDEGGMLSALEITPARTPGLTRAVSYNDIAGTNPFSKWHRCSRALTTVSP